MPALVGLSVEAERLLAVGPIGNDGLGAAISQPFAELSAVVRFITQKLLCRIGSADQPLGDRAIVRLAAGQEDASAMAGSAPVVGLTDELVRVPQPATRAAANKTRQ